MRLCSWIERLRIIKMSVIFKMIYRLNIIPVKIPGQFFVVDIDTMILKLMWKGKINRLEKRKKVVEISLPGFKTLYSYNNEESVVLEKRQTHRSVKQNGEPRNTSTKYD